MEPVAEPSPLNPKEMAQQMISRLPQDASYDDIQYHLYVLEKIRRAGADITAGKVFTHEQARQRMSQWLD